MKSSAASVSDVAAIRNSIRNRKSSFRATVEGKVLKQNIFERYIIKQMY